MSKFNEKQTRRLKLKLIIMIMGMVGYGLLLLSDWKVALGVFLVHWHINCENNLL